MARAAGVLPAAAIGTPEPGAVLDRGSVRVAGWALCAQGPVGSAVVLVDGHLPTAAGTGLASPHVARLHPHVPNADRAGWEAVVDLRSADGPGVKLSLLARTPSGDWAEMAHREVRLEDVRVPRGRRKRAVFTIVQNEPTFLPLWLRHYGRDFDPSDIYVLDHDSGDGSTDGIADRCNVVAVHRDRSFDHAWLTGTVQKFQSFLLASYDAVLFTEVDEFVVADPARYEGLGAYVDRLDGVAACCTGYNVVQSADEPPLRFNEPLLRQRSQWRAATDYSKRLLGRVPLSWGIGFHAETNVPNVAPDPELLLLHLHRIDFGYCLSRHRAAARREWSEEDLRTDLGWQNRLVDMEGFQSWFFDGPDLRGAQPEPIPERIRSLL